MLWRVEILIHFKRAHDILMDHLINEPCYTVDIEKLSLFSQTLSIYVKTIHPHKYDKYIPQIEFHKFYGTFSISYNIILTLLWA